MKRTMSDGYPFIFQMIDKSESDEYLTQTLQYRFKSEKSHHAYIVRVECYQKTENKFDHYRRNDLSLYILVNKKYVEDTASYADELASIVQRYL